MWKTLTIIAILLAGTSAALRYSNSKTAKLETELLARSEANLEAAQAHLGDAIERRQETKALADADSNTGSNADVTREKAALDTAIEQKADKESNKKLIKAQIIEKKEKLTILEDHLKEIGDIEAAVSKSETLQIEMATVRQELAIAKAAFKNIILTREATQQRIADIKVREAMQVSGQMRSINARVSQNHSQWNFVVISAGGRQGVNANTKLDVLRGGRVIGKLRVTNLESNQSVCDVLSVIAGENISTGDRVVVSSDSKWDPSKKVTQAAEPAAAAATPAADTTAPPIVPAAADDDPFGLDPAPDAADDDPFGLDPAPDAADDDPFESN